MNLSIDNVAICGISSTVPDNIVLNNNKILSKHTGIKQIFAKKTIKLKHQIYALTLQKNY